MNESVQIEIHDLTKIYKLNKKQMQESHTKNPKKTAVDHLTLTAKSGEIYGLLGPNGAGKTTLMRMICGILKPDRGSVCCDGMDIRRMGKEYRGLLGYLPQDFGYYGDFSVWRFLHYMAALKALPEPWAKQRIEELLEQHGSDKEHILSTTIYLKDISDFAGMNSVWDPWVAKGNEPARACVEAALAAPSIKVEMSVTAAVKD